MLTTEEVGQSAPGGGRREIAVMGDEGCSGDFVLECLMRGGFWEGQL